MYSKSRFCNLEFYWTTFLVARATSDTRAQCLQRSVVRNLNNQSTLNFSCLVDVIDSGIPLLLSKPDMQHLGFRLNMENNTLEVDGRVIELDTTSSEYYYLPVNNREIEVHHDYLAIQEKII